jgi:acyl-coenzyme A synthetase/AMP-(fatty) acid ligase
MTEARVTYTAPLPPPRFNMARYSIGRAAAANPDKAALVVVSDPEASAPAELLTYAALDDAVRRIAAGLADLGLARGDRLLIRLENTSAFALLFFGAIAGGFVPIPASTQLTEREADFLRNDSGAELVALSVDLPEPSGGRRVRCLRPADVAALIGHARRGDYADTAADEPAFLIYTSGTTSQPKGVLHGHRSAWGRRPMYRGWYGIGQDDRVLHAGAFNWTYTLGVGLTDPWANGATAIVYTGDKNPTYWPRLIARHDATIFAAVPSLYRQILKYAAPTPADLGRLRHGLIAGEKPPAGLFDDWHAATGRQLYEAFGMSELSTYVSCAPGIERKPDFIGPAQAGRAVAILPVDGGTDPLPRGEEGLIAIHRSDPGLMLGYWQRPKEEAEVMRGDWFVGSDLGVMDEAGYIAHRGRANDIMKALGYRVSPQEVEAALAEHPAVAEVACTEVQVRADVSVIGAFIVCRPGATATPQAIKDFAAARLAAYKCPREVAFVDSLPRTANGKLKRNALKL